MLVSQEKAALIKDQLKKEQQAWHHTQRYGLFSYLPDHGFGFRDNQTQPNRRDETGKVTTAPRNFMGGRPKTSHPAKDSFTQTGYLSQNDEYMNPTQAMRYREQNPNKAKEVHGNAFRPSGTNAKKIQAPYEYVSDPMQPNRSAPAPKNFVTAPLKRGKGNTTVGHLFSSSVYETDPFDYPNQMNSLERKEHAGKIRDGAFFTTFKKRDHFTPNMHVYRNPSGMSLAKQKLAMTTSGLRPFLSSNPAKKGYNCTINRFPEYTEEGEQHPDNHRRAQTASGLWKPTYREKSVPTISIQHYNATNRPRHRF